MNAEQSQPRAVGFSDVVLNNLVLIIVAGLAGLLFGFAATTMIDERASATTSILLNPLDGNPFYPGTRGEDLVNLGTEAQALQSDQVAAETLAKLGQTGAPGSLLGNVSVGVPANTQILEVTYSARRPEVALERSQAVAETYLAHRTARASARVATQMEQLDAQIAANDTATQGLVDQLNTLPGDSAEAAVIRQQIEGLASQSSTLGAKKAELATTPMNPGQVVAPASLDGGGMISMKLLLPIAGLLGGLGFGVFVALLRSRRDLRIHHATEVRDAGLAVLGVIGDLPPNTPTSGPLHDERVDDEYRRIRVALLARNTSRPCSVLIASASTDSEAPVSPVDLGVSLARAGIDTIIVDTTSHGAGPGHVLGQRDGSGLSEVLSGLTTFDESVHSVGPMLWVVGPGAHRDEIADLLTGGDMSRVMSLARDRAEVIILAGDSIQFGSSQSLASIVDHVVIEVDQDGTTTEELDRARRALELLPRTTTAAIFVGAEATRRRDPYVPVIVANRGQLPAAPLILAPTHSSVETDDTAGSAEGKRSGSTQ